LLISTDAAFLFDPASRRGFARARGDVCSQIPGIR
jgi:hypothetical protein